MAPEPRPDAYDSPVVRGSALALISLAACLAYANSFSGTFVFDDKVHIHANQRIQDPWPPAHLLSGRRPLVDVSLAVNFALHGLDAAGYHAWNLGVHLCAGWALFGVIRRSAQIAQLGGRRSGSPTALAAAVTLLWIVHPLTTQAVTYIVQRGESMMALFYLLTLYGLLRAARTTRPVRWLAVSVVSCALGMVTKSVMISAPLAALLCDKVFLSGSFRQGLRARWRYYLALGATLLLIVATGDAWGVLDPAPGRNRAVGFGLTDVTALQYALTQGGVILHYLKLAVWPVGLCFDYAWPMVDRWRSAVPAVTTVLVLLVLTIWAVMRNQPLGFAGAVFFLVLGPTSSIVPIRDAAVEHRMYLPLAVVVLLLVVGIRKLLTMGSAAHGAVLRRSSLVATVLVFVTAMGFGMSTARRNRVYASEESLWLDTVQKRPGNARAFLNYGSATFDPAAAVQAFQQAIELRPDYADAWYNLGRAFAAQDELERAVEHYRSAIRHDPLLAEAYFNMGNAFDRLGRSNEALAAYADAVRIAPTYVRAHYNLGNALYKNGEWSKALERFENVLKLVDRRTAPSLVAETHFNMGTILARLDRVEEASAHFDAALSIDPRHDRARRALLGLRR